MTAVGAISSCYQSTTQHHQPVNIATFVRYPSSSHLSSPSLSPRSCLCRSLSRSNWPLRLSGGGISASIPEDLCSNLGSEVDCPGSYIHWKVTILFRKSNQQTKFLTPPIVLQLLLHIFLPHLLDSAWCQVFIELLLYDMGCPVIEAVPF
jgi:hypothetical protein